MDVVVNFLPGFSGKKANGKWNYIFFFFSREVVLEALFSVVRWDAFLLQSQMYGILYYLGNEEGSKEPVTFLEFLLTYSIIP